MCVSVSFVRFLSFVVIEEDPCTLLSTDQWNYPPIVFVLLYVVHRNFLHYRALIPKDLSKSGKAKKIKEKLSHDLIINKFEL